MQGGGYTGDLAKGKAIYTVAAKVKVGLVVTDVPKVSIWKALSINGLRHGVRSNILILWESQLCQCDTHLATRMQARLRPARHLVALIWLARNRQETDLASASADIALALAADAADGGAIKPEDASDIGIAAEAISMPFARPTSAKVHIMGAPLFRTLQPARRRRRRSIGGNIDTSVRNGFRRGCQHSRSSTSSPLTRTNLPRFGNGGAP